MKMTQSSKYVYYLRAPVHYWQEGFTYHAVEHLPLNPHVESLRGSRSLLCSAKDLALEMGYDQWNTANAKRSAASTLLASS